MNFFEKPLNQRVNLKLPENTYNQNDSERHKHMNDLFIASSIFSRVVISVYVAFVLFLLQMCIPIIFLQIIILSSEIFLFFSLQANFLYSLQTFPFLGDFFSL